jgi:hypothetical protein
MNASNLRLIVIHIHKTGGMSMKNILRRVYGAGYFRLNIDSSAGTEPLADAIPASAVALHGHFKFRDVAGLYRATGARLVTWLREPAERVASKYYFERLKADEGKPHSVGPGEALLDFACRPSERNAMSRALDGISLHELFFVGMTERFQKDARLLARLMGWGDIDVPHANSNSTLRARVKAPSEGEMEEIRNLNELDCALYAEALRLRESKHVQSVL